MIVKLDIRDKVLVVFNIWIESEFNYVCFQTIHLFN